MKLANWGLIKELIDMSDIVLEVVDIRDPIHTRSPKLESMVLSAGKPLLIVLNKSDLVPRSIAEEWREFFEGRGIGAVYISARDRLGTKILRDRIKEMVSKRPIVVAITGLPKVGKSTLINTLKGRHSAGTSPYPGTPGYTRRSQLYRVERNIYVIDSPGLVPPEGDDVEVIIRSTPVDDMENVVSIAAKLIMKILTYNQLAFKAAYGIDEGDPIKILEALAIRRGWVTRGGGEPLITEAAKCVIRDYLDGKLTYYIRPQQLGLSPSEKA